MDDFAVDEQLANDTVVVGDLALTRVLLMRDRRFSWAVLVPRVAGAVEIMDLSPEDRARLIEEAALVAAALKRLAQPHKINIGALGNIVRQLHVHVVAREVGDEAWPGPVWGSGPPLAYGEGEAEACAEALRAALGI
jgi:diadenosine tetraphosphate (Ap4A) HIT family hydrolase